MKVVSKDIVCISREQFFEFFTILGMSALYTKVYGKSCGLGKLQFSPDKNMIILRTGEPIKFVFLSCGNTFPHLNYELQCIWVGHNFYLQWTFLGWPLEMSQMSLSIFDSVLCLPTVTCRLFAIIIYSFGVKDICYIFYLFRYDHFLFVSDFHLNVHIKEQ